MKKLSYLACKFPRSQASFFHVPCLLAAQSRDCVRLRLKVFGKVIVFLKIQSEALSVL